jgi:YVTN family beta-propeller protein
MINRQKKLNYIFSILSVMIIVLSAYSFAEHTEYTAVNSNQNLMKENELSSSYIDKPPSHIALKQIIGYFYPGTRTYKSYQATCVPNDGVILVRVFQEQCYVINQIYHENEYLGQSFLAKLSSDGKFLNYCIPVVMNTSKGNFFNLYPNWESVDNYNSIVPNPNNNLVYISSCFTNNVSVFNPQTDTFVKNISVGNCPASMYLDPQNSILYVANHGGSNVSLINISDNELVGNISVGRGPSGIIYDPHDREIYVANAYSENISVIDPNTQKVVKSINVSASPGQMIMNANGSSLFTDNYFNNSISIVNVSANSARTIEIIGGNPINLLYDNESNSIFVTQNDHYNISIFNLNTNTLNSVNMTIFLPMTLFYDSQDNFIIVTSFFGGHLFASINPITNKEYQLCGDVAGNMYSNYVYSPDSGKQIFLYMYDDCEFFSYEIVNQTNTLSITEIYVIIVFVVMASTIGYLIYRRHQFWKD